MKCAVLDIGLPSARSRARIRMALLLGATALTGISPLCALPAFAQVVINQNGASAPDRGPLGFDDAGENGGAGGSISNATPGAVNNANQINVNGSAFVGTANGGKGGDGGFGGAGIPIATKGGDGGDGGVGGSVDTLNNAILSTIGESHHGIAASAVGGNGGDGGGAAPAAANIGGNGGHGAAGGSAKAVASATSDITTVGKLSYGILSNASGGNGGGGGGFAAGLGVDAGDGGNGASGGLASASNAGSIKTSGFASHGILVRSAGGVGGDGASGIGLLTGGGNGGAATIGGTAVGDNSGNITTGGNFAIGMAVQSVGGGGGDGGGAFGLFGGGGAGAAGNDGGSATATNTGNITTYGVGAIGMLVESVGGGGGDGGGAAGIVAIGGSGAGGGNGAQVSAHLGGKIITGANGGADGAHGVLVQSVGGGGGNGGYAFATGNIAAVAVGGSGATGGHGEVVNVDQAGGGVIVSTNGSSAIGILAQSVGGGGGNGGGAFAIGGATSIASVAVGGRGGAAGNGSNVNYNIANANVTTWGTDSIGILAQSVGGGGGNGGFALSSALVGSVGVGGSGSAGGSAGKVDVKTGGIVNTHQDRSAGIVAQSIGGGGGNGGFTVAAAGLVAGVAIGGEGGSGGSGGEVVFSANQQSVTTRGADSIGVIAQSIGGGGGNGGFAGAVAAGAAVGVGGSGGIASHGGTVTATYNGSVDTFKERSIGILVQSVGGGGGNGGGALDGAGIASLGVGGSGGKGGNGGKVSFNSQAVSVHTRQADSAGIIVQSIGGGGGNGGFTINALSIGSIGVGGHGDVGGHANVFEDTNGNGKLDEGEQEFTAVSVNVVGGQVNTGGDRSSGIIAQAIGGGGGTGGNVVNVGVTNITVGGSGGGGGDGGIVEMINGAAVTTSGIQSHGLLAQSLGGGGGSGGFALAQGGPSLAIGGAGDAGGSSAKVTVRNTGTLFTSNDLSVGLLAQSIGGGGGDGGVASADGRFAAVGVGGKGGGGGNGGKVEVVNIAKISTKGAFAHGILAQSVGGGGGNGGSAGTEAEGIFAGVAVAVGGAGGPGRDGMAVDVTHSGDIEVEGIGAKGILAQSVGGGGGNGGKAYSSAYSTGLHGSLAAAVSVGGEGGDGGIGGNVTVRADGNIRAGSAIASGGIVAQSIGGGGGNGGRTSTITGAVSDGVAVNLGVGVGGGAGGGGNSGAVVVQTGLNGAGRIETNGFQSVGILAQSIGGGGGNGGDSIGGAEGYGNNVTVSADVKIGGGGGDGDFAGKVRVTNAMTIVTSGDSSSAIVAQSIGGGGGMGGSSTGKVEKPGAASGVNVGATFAMGGKGGGGSYGDEVVVTNSSLLQTSGDFSYGIIAQSIGGGGGIGGSSMAMSQGAASQTNVNVNLALAGAGGGASEGRLVTVNNSGFISTAGFGSSGIVAMSVGGGGGAAGATSASDDDAAEEGEGGGKTKVSIGVVLALGETGGAAGDGGGVDVTNSGVIFTNDAFSHGISASSIGGGGGIGGAATAGAEAEYAIGGGIGGKGGSSGDGQTVEVRNLAGGWIWTRQENSIGIFAQSIGGGGGAGGAGNSTGSNGGTVDVKMSMGGEGAGGGDGGIVNVTNAGFIETDKANSHGIMAQSVGGSGGLGGASGSSTANADVTVNFALGGLGGDGGIGQAVTVKNLVTGTIWTKGDNSHGIFAQSVGGGGGAAGGGSTESGKSKTVNVSLSIGGMGGDGNAGGTVRVDNFGQILTEGALSHGIFAQSVGGGGGAAGSASNTSSADMSVGVEISTGGGEGAKGESVEVNNDGLIKTLGHGAIGIMAQSVGGGGGYTGVVSNVAASDDAFALSVGGRAGNGGNGGVVKVTVSGDIITGGERAHGVVAQSIGGGGGYGGDAMGKTSNQLAIGGLGGAGGDGNNVTVERTGTIKTTGKDSIAIIAQSIGGGGGFGGAGFGRFGASADGGSGLDNNTIGFTSPGGDKGTGGIVTIIQTGEITTVGDRSHGIVAQAVGGGGGAGGTSSLAMGQSGAGSRGGIGNAMDATATANSQVTVAGASAYALFGQSATGQGNSGAVTLTAQASLFAQGLGSVAAYGESTSNIGNKGNITINLNGAYTVGGGGDIGVAAMLVGGTDNVLNNHSLLYAMGHDFEYSYVGGLSTEPVPVNAILESLLDDFSPLAIMGTSGNDRIENIHTATTLGRVIGNIDLGTGLNSFHNGRNSSMVGLAALDLGGGLFANDGLMSNKGIGVIATVKLTGGYTQTSDGAYVTDLDLDTQTNDFLDLSEAGDFDGEAPLNFLSIDRLFGEYLLSRGDAMTDSGLTPTTLRPTVGFDFRTRVDDGTDLVLYADKPSFESLIKNPASGVTDTGAIQMAQYLDGLEDVMSPADAPSQLARMINMIRFLPDEVEFGKAMMRLTPHYAVHTLEMANRVTDMVLESTQECFDRHRPIAPDGSCIWFSITPGSHYKRDAGFGTAERSDQFDTLSFGGLSEFSRNWSLGAALARSEFESDISFNGEELSTLNGSAWQAYALAKYDNGAYFADIAVGGGTGNTDGKRDTTLAQVGYIPGETLEGVYLPELLLEGIGNSVSFSQDIAQFGASVRFGYSYYPTGNAYVQPTLQFDARHIRVSGTERGSVAAFTFDGTSNAYFSVTPGLELGTDVAISDRASLRLYAKGGIEFSNVDWKIEGQLKAAEGLGAPPLRLTEEADSPVYRLGGGVELNGVNGVGLSVRYDGAFGENVEHQSVSGTLKVRF